MECSEDLCIDAENHKVIIKNLQLNGMLYDTTGYSASDSASLRLTGEGVRWDEPLTWAGSTHGLIDCSNINGTVFDTGSGTICRISQATVPTGWTQAANWQRYSIASWGGDACGRHVSTAPTTWSNTLAINYGAGSVQCTIGCGTCAGGFVDHWWAYNSSSGPIYTLTITSNPTSYRVEVGVY